MTDLDAALLDTWTKVKPKLDADTDELNRRLARRRTRALMRPPREWCIAVRASDHRITPMHAAIAPEFAVDVPNPYSTCYRFDHTVRLDKRLLRRLCQPVRLTAPHEDVLDIARMLGVHRDALNLARQRGVLNVEHYKGLFGRHGKPVPMLFTRDLLDPNFSRFWRRPHPIWGTLWQYLSDFVPDDFEQTIHRVPFMVGTWQAVRAGAADKELFRGWRWVCPGCRKQVRTLFYPVTPLNFLELLGIDPASPKRGAANARPEMPPCFACRKCHRVVYFSPVQRGSWNQYVTYLSAGLLYGHEVEKPAWFRPERRQAYRPLPRAKPSLRQQQVLAGLKKGWTMKQIAQDLGNPQGHSQQIRADRVPPTPRANEERTDATAAPDQAATAPQKPNPPPAR